MKSVPQPEPIKSREFFPKTNIGILRVAVLVFVVYYFSNPHPGSFYDYTFRLAGALLHGKLGVEQQPPSWLSEFIPANGRYYAGFPLGSVLTMTPFAALQQFGLIDEFPGRFLSAAIAAAATVIFLLLSGPYALSWRNRLMLGLLPALGTWMWCNLAFASTWQIILGFGLLGQLLALYFILIKPRPLFAGLGFALAFGNRSELIVLAPLLMYLIYRGQRNHWRQAIVRFSIPPVILVVLTMAYNYARFSSPLDFGNSHIPGVLNEPWYKHGIFSLYAIPVNMKEMLFQQWKTLAHYPYLVPTGFGGSIFLACPFLFFLFARRARDPRLKLLCWVAISLLTLCLWTHGNPGGWQFAYRYAIDLLPWMYLILLENSPVNASPLDVSLFGLSVVINAWATYLFLWTSYVTP